MPETSKSNRSIAFSALCWALSGCAIALGLFMMVAVLVACFAPFGEMSIALKDGTFQSFSYAIGEGAATLSDGAVMADTQIPASDLGPAWRLIVFVWAAVPVAFLLFGLNGARKCFAGIARGRFFELATVRGLRNFALGVLLYMVSEPIIRMAYTPFIGDRLGANGAPFSMTISGDTILILLFAGAVSVAASALARAAAIAEENEQFI